MAQSSFLQRYEAFARQVTDAPYIFHQLLAYGALSVAVGNRWKMRYFGGGWLTPHLWIFLLADSSTFHKSEALRVARRCLAKLSNRMLNWEGSHKALVEQFAANDQGVMIAFEFEQFLGHLQQNYMSGGRGMFTDLYDGELAGTVFKASGVQQWKEQLAISFFTGSTPAQLADWLKERDISAGLLPRFVMVHANRQEQSFALPPADDGSIDRTLLGLQNALLSYSETYGEMTLTPGAIKLYESWYKRMKQVPLDSSRADPWKTRLATACLKFAMLNQLDQDWQGKVNEKSMRDAMTLTDTMLGHVAHVCQEELSLSHFEEQAKRLKYVLKKYAPMYGTDGWLDWSFILPHMKMQADQLRKIAQTLDEAKQIEWKRARPQTMKLVVREPGEQG
jgi:Protein of unknown function (DUF3987)